MSLVMIKKRIRFFRKILKYFFIKYNTHFVQTPRQLRKKPDLNVTFSDQVHYKEISPPEPCYPNEKSVRGKWKNSIQPYVKRSLDEKYNPTPLKKYRKEEKQGMYTTHKHAHLYNHTHTYRHIYIYPGITYISNVLSEYHIYKYSISKLRCYPFKNISTVWYYPKIVIKYYMSITIS